ncbi:hypothetical protein [Streptomyces sp. NPDC057280]|uniref:hypothetical protein n=1 Tax=Streptomyces sp. NPDC057280 TaxID=3346081 RepID=UPI003629E29B
MSDHTAIVLLTCALSVVIALMCGTAAGYLARRDGASYPAVCARAASTAARAVALAAAIAGALAVLRR